MTLLDDVFDIFEDIGYDGELKDEAPLLEELSGGLTSVKFRVLISSIANQLVLFHDLKKDYAFSSDIDTFSTELSQFLIDYGCPYKALTTGEISQRFNTKDHCLQLLFFLLSELQAAKIYYHNNPVDKKELENEIFNDLKHICITLNLSKPSDGISLETFLTGITKKLQTTVINLPSNYLNKPALTQTLSPECWSKLEALNKLLAGEYSLRRKMLLKRLDVTLASFNWSERAKANVNSIAEVYQAKRHSMTSESNVSIADLLAAKEDICQISKTSSGSTRHTCAINKVLIGKVPDRGGRTTEIAPPPAEMPAWSKRVDPGPQHGGRGGFNNRGRGGSYRGRGRGGHQDRPNSARSDGGSRWSRGGKQNQRGSFDKVFNQGGRSYGQDGFSSGRNFSS